MAARLVSGEEPKRIHVNSIKPAWSKRRVSMKLDLQAATRKRHLEAQTPLGRIAQPADIAPPRLPGEIDQQGHVIEADFKCGGPWSGGGAGSAGI